MIFAMTEPNDDSPTASYEEVRERMRAYWASIRKYADDEEAALDAIPGYREWREQAFAQAKVSPDGTAQIAYPKDLEAEIAAVASRFSHQRAEQEAERKRVVAAVAQLDASGVEKLLEERGENSAGISFALNMLACSRNPQAAAPLIARLQREVPFKTDHYDGNRFQKFVASYFPFVRQMRRETHETHRVLDRSMTLRALGHTGDVRVEPVLRSFLTDTDERVREAAQKALQAVDVAER